MRTIKTCIAGLLMMSIIGLHLPTAAFCDDAGQLVAIYNKTITQHKVRAMSTTEDTSVKKVKKDKKKMGKWLLIGAGVALVIGLAAAGGGGGSDDGGGNGVDDGQGNPSSDTGSATVGW
ncbi:MAG: hypothetical protein PVJ19_12885 [Desulfobacteraceae bacterium]|jgi:hypothetical protein